MLRGTYSPFSSQQRAVLERLIRGAGEKEVTEAWVGKRATQMGWREKPSWGKGVLAEARMRLGINVWKKWGRDVFKKGRASVKGSTGWAYWPGSSGRAWVTGPGRGRRVRDPIGPSRTLRGTWKFWVCREAMRSFQQDNDMSFMFQVYLSGSGGNSDDNARI